MKCSNHRPVPCEGGTICLTCQQFTATAGQELRSSYRTAEKRPQAQGGASVSVEARSKYNAKKTEVDGILFDSGREAARYRELCLLQASGVISDLVTQPEFQMFVNGQRVSRYRADFQYTENGAVIVEDVKSLPTMTPVYRLKKRLMRAILGIEIKETR